MSVSFGKFQDSSDSRQSAKLNLAPFKLKTAPFRVNLPKSFIWSDPKFSEADGKTPAAFSLPLCEHSGAFVLLCLERDSDPWSLHPINPLSPAQRQHTAHSGFSSLLLFSIRVFRAVSQALMPVDKSQSYFSAGNTWRHFANILLCNALDSGFSALMLQN